MDPELDEYGEPVPPPDSGLAGALFVVAVALYLAVADLLTARVLLVAALRVAIGAAIMTASTLAPEPVAGVGAFAGKMFIFLALYGLVTPLESRITGGLADRILRKERTS